MAAGHGRLVLKAVLLRVVGQVATADGRTGDVGGATTAHTIGRDVAGAALGAFGKHSWAFGSLKTFGLADDLEPLKLVLEVVLQLVDLDP